MAERQHHYEVTVVWTGNLGEGTRGYRGYSRDLEISAAGKPAIPGSSDPTFRGDRSRYSPEDLLVISLAQCHMLWYLHLCAEAGVVVTGYTDLATGTMAESADGSGQFTEVVLRPRIDVAEAEMVDRAAALNERAHELCFIARSVNFAVRCQPAVEVSTPSA